MPSRGIRDRVAVVGMGCTRFGEHWGRSIDDLLIDAVGECVGSVAGFERSAIDAYWLGTMGSGTSGLTLARPLKIDHKPVTRVENYCATGSEAFRNACYAVASGAYDCVMAVGGEKLKDAGFSGLVVPPATNDGTASEPSAPAVFSLLAPAYARKYGISDERLKEVMARIAWKNHRNGARNERAQFRSEVPMETIAASPIVAGALGIHDCSGVADGAAAALIVRAQDALDYTDRPMYVKALSLVAGPAQGPVTRATTSRASTRSSPRRGTPTRRRASRTRARRSRSPRSTTASPRPSSCSWRTSASPRAARAGGTS